MFDKKIFVSIGLAFLIAFSAVGSVYNIKQTLASYSSNGENYITATKTHQSNDLTTVNASEFSQAVYTNVKLDISSVFTTFGIPTSDIAIVVSKATTFYTLHYIYTAIFKMLFPFHTFW